ncbi:MAG: hypothetical protein HKN14_13585 [Marinicaulis sp.]|nr:hypothetical protein [Marinicaulis sp.]
MNKKRNSGLVFLHAIVWAAGTLGESYVFKSEPWAQNLIPWMAVAFIFSNGVLLAATGKGRGC